MSAEPGDVTRWGEVLAELAELVEHARPHADAQSVERLAGWRPPQGLGPLPAGFVGWAEALRDQLERRAEALRAAMAATQQQRRLADHVPAARPADTSAYLDVHG